jgi:hypothetical protein
MLRRNKRRKKRAGIDPMISSDPEFNEKVLQVAEINRRAGDYVAPSPFPSRVFYLDQGEDDTATGEQQEDGTESKQ